MSLDFTMGESRPKLPDGSYFTTFTGTSQSEAREWQGEKLPPGVCWEFSVSSGPHQGGKLQRITGPTPTPKNGCGAMIAGLLGGMPTPGQAVNLQQCVGKPYLAVVKGGKIESVSVPPQQ